MKQSRKLPGSHRPGEGARGLGRSPKTRGVRKRKTTEGARNHKTADGARGQRSVRFLVRLLTSYRWIPFADLENSDWGSYGTITGFLKAINDEWMHHRGEPLFEYVDADGNPWQKGRERFIMLADSALRMYRATPLAVLPVYAQFLRPLHGTPIAELMQQVQKVGKKALSRAEARHLEHMERKFYFHGKGFRDYGSQSPLIETLYRAVIEQRLIRCVYAGSTRYPHVERCLMPLTILLYNNGLYVVGHEVDRDGAVIEPGQRPRKYRVERLAAVTLLPRFFEYPRTYDPAALFGSAFGLFDDGRTEHLVRLEFLTPDAARYAGERRWTDADQHGEHNGNFTLAFRATDLTEVKGWVLSFGGSVRVLGPERLVQLMQEEVSRLGVVYSAGKTPA